MNKQFTCRTELLLGKEKLEKLINSNVLVVGLGGVGAYAAELICRAGVGKMTIVDGDIYQQSNLNRQLGALHSTTGKSKALYMTERLKDINSEIKINTINKYITDAEMPSLLNEKYDYVIDAIDTLSPKVQLIYHSIKKGIPLVSSMGAGLKIDPLKVKITDISKSYNCGLARMIRKKLHKLGIYKGFKVVYSPEEAAEESIIPIEGERNKKSIVGTISYMPPVFGCFCASVVIQDLIST